MTQRVRRRDRMRAQRRPICFVCKQAAAVDATGQCWGCDVVDAQTRTVDLNTPPSPEEFAARLAEVRPDLEAAMRQGIAEADAAREAADRARGEAWKRLEGRRFK